MRAPVTVITASIPGREALLAETLASVYNQVPDEVDSHLVMAQSCSEGLPSTVHCARQQNLLLQAVETEWTMRLADDDRLLPDHIKSIKPFLRREFDIVYSWDATGNRPRVDCTQWSQERLIETLAGSNFIDGSAVWYRTFMLDELDGWPTDFVGTNIFDGHFRDVNANCEDWALFYMAARMGYKFACCPVETWLYGAGPWDRISTVG